MRTPIITLTLSLFLVAISQTFADEQDDPFAAGQADPFAPGKANPGKANPGQADPFGGPAKVDPFAAPTHQATHAERRRSTLMKSRANARDVEGIEKSRELLEAFVARESKYVSILEDRIAELAEYKKILTKKLDQEATESDRERHEQNDGKIKQTVEAVYEAKENLAMAETFLLEAQFRLKQLAARKLLKQREQLVAERTKELLGDPADDSDPADSGNEGEQNAGIDCTLYTKPYEANEHGAFKLPQNVQWKVMPRYLGITDDGKRIVDERLTLLLIDGERSFWPVIAKMSLDQAEDLQRQLAAMITQKQKSEAKP